MAIATEEPDVRHRLPDWCNNPNTSYQHNVERYL
jgi:hypothetical protein